MLVVELHLPRSRGIAATAVHQWQCMDTSIYAFFSVGLWIRTCLGIVVLPPQPCTIKLGMYTFIIYLYSLYQTVDCKSEFARESWHSQHRCAPMNCACIHNIRLWINVLLSDCGSGLAWELWYSRHSCAPMDMSWGSGVVNKHFCSSMRISAWKSRNDCCPDGDRGHAYNSVYKLTYLQQHAHLSIC